MIKQPISEERAFYTSYNDGEMSHIFFEPRNQEKGLEMNPVSHFFMGEAMCGCLLKDCVVRIYHD